MRCDLGACNKSNQRGLFREYLVWSTNSYIYFWTAQPIGESRNANLLLFLASCLDGRSSLTYESNGTLFSFLGRVIKRKLLGCKAISIFGFNNRYHLVSFLILKLLSDYLICDIGYRAADNTRISIFRKVFFSLIEFIYIKLSDVCLVESTEQGLRKVFKRWKVFYCSHTLLTTSISHQIKSNQLRSLPGEYILFRGDYNPESGLNRLVEMYLIAGIDIPLVIHSRNYPLGMRVLSHKIHYITENLTNEELSNLIANCLCMLGQAGTEIKRLNYTIPHKLFEALRFGKHYFSLKTPPLNSIKNEFELEEIKLFESLEDLFEGISESVRCIDVQKTEKNDKLLLHNQDLLASILFGSTKVQL